LTLIVDTHFSVQGLEVNNANLVL